MMLLEEDLLVLQDAALEGRILLPAPGCRFVSCRGGGYSCGNGYSYGGRGYGHSYGNGRGDGNGYGFGAGYGYGSYSYCGKFER